MFRLMVYTFVVAVPVSMTIANDPLDEASATRIQFMQTALSHFDATVIDPATGKPEPSRLIAPLLRWSNPLEGAKDGIIGVFARGGRPDAYVEFQMFSEMSQGHEFTAITPSELEVRRRGRMIWKPAERWVDFAEIDAETPRPTTTLRLIQMRNIARRFRVVDEFGGDDQNIQSNELRLIPKPVYRYAGGEIVDGALFIFALGTDPEAFLLVEAWQKPGEEKPRWRYALGESTIYELNGWLGDEKVWHKPRALIFDSPTFTHFAGQYPRSTDDVSLEGTMQAK